MRYLIKYTKESNIKFISHLDLMRTIQKIIRRSEIQIKYSKGFNPHMVMSIAQPLSVGVYSEGEYMDIVLVEEVNENEIINKLNEKTASGIKFKSATKIPTFENVKKVPQGMALIDACRYTIKIKYNSVDKTSNEIDELLKEKEWQTIKKTKKGQREMNIKELVYEFKYCVKEKELILSVLIQSGSREHLGANLLVRYIKEQTTNYKEDSFDDIKREEMYYRNKKEELTPLYNLDNN